MILWEKSIFSVTCQFEIVCVCVTALLWNKICLTYWSVNNSTISIVKKTLLCVQPLKENHVCMCAEHIRKKEFEKVPFQTNSTFLWKDFWCNLIKCGRTNQSFRRSELIIQTYMFLFWWMLLVLVWQLSEKSVQVFSSCRSAAHDLILCTTNMHACSICCNLIQWGLLWVLATNKLHRGTSLLSCLQFCPM